MTKYKIVRMKRKSVSITVSDDLCVIVKAPFFVSEKTIDDFVRKNEKWINEVVAKKQRKNELYSEEYVKELFEKGKSYLEKRVPYFSEITGFYPASVGITTAKTRFGSCSGKNRLNFSVFLFSYPDDVIDYVILHELCHIKHKNHSKSFYAEVEKYMPDYRQRQKQLKILPDDEKNS